MATVACPSCGLPRAEDLFDVAPCPVCGHDGAFPVAEAESSGELPFPGSPGTPPGSPRLAVPPEPASGGLHPRLAKPLSLGLLLGFALGIAAGAGGVVGWQALAVRAPAADPNAVVEASGPTDDGGSRAVALAPLPREVGSASPAPNAPVEPVPAPPPANPLPRAKEPIVAGLPPEPIAPNPFRPAAPAAMRLDNPNGTNDAIVGPGRTLVLRGQVKTLRVRGLEAGAVLDCSDLETQEVIVVGKIDGASTLWLTVSNGRVTFQAKVDGKSRVGIVAPGGTVVFANPGGGRAEGATVAGGSTVEVKARSVNFQGLISGPGTRVAVTLTAGGSLGFAEIDGPSRLEYGKADPDDSDPAVIRGKVGPPAVVTRIED